MACRRSEAVREGECSRCNGCFNADGMLPSAEKDVILSGNIFEMRFEKSWKPKFAVVCFSRGWTMLRGNQNLIGGPGVTEPIRDAGSPRHFCVPKRNMCKPAHTLINQEPALHREPATKSTASGIRQPNRFSTPFHKLAHLLVSTLASLIVIMHGGAEADDDLSLPKGNNTPSLCFNVTVANISISNRPKIDIGTSSLRLDIRERVSGPAYRLLRRVHTPRFFRSK